MMSGTGNERKSPICSKLDPDKIIVQRHLPIGAIVAVELILSTHPLILVPSALGVNRHWAELTADQAATTTTVKTPVDVDHLPMVGSLLLNPAWPPMLVAHNVSLGHLDGAGRDAGISIVVAGWAPQTGGKLSIVPHYRVFGVVTGAGVTCMSWTNQWGEACLRPHRCC